MLTSNFECSSENKRTSIVRKAIQFRRTLEAGLEPLTERKADFRDEANIFEEGCVQQQSQCWNDLLPGRKSSYQKIWAGSRKFPFSYEISNKEGQIYLGCSTVHSSLVCTAIEATSLRSRVSWKTQPLMMTM